MRASRTSGSRSGTWKRSRAALMRHRQFIRTVPVLPHDEIDMDDVNNKAEDHMGEAGIHPREERRKGPLAARSSSPTDFSTGTLDLIMMQGPHYPPNDPVP
jgi:hypothetical protein